MRDEPDGQIVPAADCTFLFQYGSNMAEQTLRSKIEQHRGEFAPTGTPTKLTLHGCARLRGWRFSLDLYSFGHGCRVADITETTDSDEVWGALYELPTELVQRRDGKRSVLDRIEGHNTTRDPENYAPVKVTVDFDGAAAEAWTYVGLEAARERCARDHHDARVTATYADSILGGAKTLAMPTANIEQLRATLARYA